ncbi:cadherin repeat domain-containing protein, partial [Synechocystis salina LEGE 06155]|nr:cadherin repeat domain-containing protein [Synechocystis salina LEGE 06155]
SYALSGTANTADFNSDDLEFSQFLVFTDGDVQYTRVRTIDDTTIEGNEAFSFQLVLDDFFALDIRDGNGRIARLDPDDVNDLFAAAGGITFNIGAITGTIIDNDFPNRAPSITSGNTGTVAENAPTTTVVYDANASDPDTTAPNNSLSFSLSGADASLFTIDSDDGEVRLKNSANFEAKNSYSLNVIVTDGG